MRTWKSFPRVALVISLLLVLCAGLFAPRVEQVRAKPVGAIDELNIFISEFRTRGPNGADDEFIEIYNASSGNVLISGWKIRKSSGCGTTLTDLVTIGLVTLAPGQYYLIAKSGTYSGTTTPDLLYTTPGVADDGGIALTNASNSIIDQVGLCNDTAYKEGITLNTLSGESDQSYERKTGGSVGSCKDTDDNASDFLLTSPSSPQNFSSAVIPCLAVINVYSSITSPATYLDTSNAVIDIQLTFSNIITVTGFPTLMMETGVTDRSAVFTGGSGTNTLTFSYTIQPGDNTNDLDYVSYNALSLNGGSIIGATGDAILILPKPGALGSLSANEDILIDNGSASPLLVSITRQMPTNQHTNADTIMFRVTFSDSMLNVDSSDFIVTGTTGSLTLSRGENGRYYDLSITGGDLTNLNGTVNVNLNLATQDITSIGGIPLPNIAPSIVENYIVDNTSPSISYIRQIPAQPDPTNTLPISFDVAFSEVIDSNTFTSADIRQNGTSTGIIWSITNPSNDGQNFVLSVSASSAGILVPSIDATRIRDLAGNSNVNYAAGSCVASEPNNCVTFNDAISPTVTINQASGQVDPASTLPVNYIVQFSEPINTATFTTADITQTGTVTGVTWSITNSGDNMTFTLSAVATAGYGTIIPFMAANRVTDLTGNNNTASTFVDNSVSYILIPTATPTRTATPSNTRSVVINEIAWAGTASNLIDDEWIELYNPSGVAIDLTDWELRASDGTPTIILDGVIPAGGYFLLERDDDTVVSDIAANQIYTGALSNSGEILSLVDTSNKIIDTANGNGGAWPRGSSSTYGTMERIANTTDSDTAWVTNGGSPRNGKNANGGDIMGTPKNKNTTGPTPTPSRTPTATRTLPPPTVVIDPRPIINEILPRPGYDWNGDGRVDVFDEFIEIKNLTAININLKGWRLDDEANLGSDPYTLPDLVLKPGERAIFYALETNILLSDGGDTVRLINPSGKIYDAYTYAIARVEDQSICRLPDGNPGNSWFEDCIPTPNLTNSREGSVPSAPGGNAESPVCDLPDTIPADFFFAECRGYGAGIWNPLFWDATGWMDKHFLPSITGKWKSFVE